ncbi:MAG: FadR family transcriptional regulator [Anaerolineales bacterium]|nr:FadR family transcriptional regulator [Anaerolineales bacterium]
MENLLDPVKVQSLPEACIQKLEALILSGTLEIGQRLPSERQLAEMLDVSRPVVHQALVELAAKGLIEIRPRKGVYVNDYRLSGSTAILDSLFRYQEGDFSPNLLHSLIQARLLIEVKAAELAASNYTLAQLYQLRCIHESQTQLSQDDLEEIVELDFHFHLWVAVTSANLIYPLLLNSLKNVHANLAGRFYQHASPAMIQEVFDFHEKLIQAIEAHNAELAARIMTEMLEHGEKHLLRLNGKEA